MAVPEAGSLRIPRVISQALERFRSQGSIGDGGNPIHLDQLDLSGELRQADQLRGLDNQPGFDLDPRVGHVQLSREGKERLGMGHWESYRAQLSEGEVLIHASSGQSTQEYNLFTQAHGGPALVRVGVDLEEVFADAFQFEVVAGGYRALKGESAFLCNDFRATE